MISFLIYLSTALCRPPVGSHSRKQSLWVVSFFVETGREMRNVWKMANGSRQGEPLSPYIDQPACLLLQCRNSSFAFKITRHLLDLMDCLIFPPFPYYTIHASCYRGLTTSKCSSVCQKNCLQAPHICFSPTHFRTFFGVDVYKVSGNYAWVRQSWIYPQIYCVIQYL